MMMGNDDGVLRVIPERNFEQRGLAPLCGVWRLVPLCVAVV